MAETTWPSINLMIEAILRSIIGATRRGGGSG